MDQTLVRNRRNEYALQRHEQPALFGMHRDPVLARANRGWATPRFLTFRLAIEVGANIRRGAHGMCSESPSKLKKG
jgi:hypothetical protein